MGASNVRYEKGDKSQRKGTKTILRGPKKTPLQTKDSSNNTEVSQKPLNWGARVGSKPSEPTTKINRAQYWNPIKNADSEWDLTIYLPDLPTSGSWKILTHPLLKNRGELQP
eukprot:UN08652